MSSNDFYRIKEAIQYIEKYFDKQPDLKTLANQANLSPGHFQKIFKGYAGITPKDFLQYMTVITRKGLLRNHESLLVTSHELGLSRTSRLHDHFIKLTSMTPGEYKTLGKNIEIFWDIVETVLGKIFVSATQRGLLKVRLIDKNIQYEKVIQEEYPKAKVVRKKGYFDHLQEAFQRDGKKIKISAFVKGTDFQLKVWEALLEIPEGAVSTYKEIASFIGHPKAVRAVGTAIGANPIAYLIPCHRVIRGTGIIGDYRWGSEAKKAILLRELKIHGDQE
ncbi:MAG: methylated-DNA--[protein]-cysteine S-methyltransferase [Bacteriovoracaceae bacterium]